MMMMIKMIYFASILHYYVFLRIGLQCVRKNAYTLQTYRIGRKNNVKGIKKGLYYIFIGMHRGKSTY